MKRKLLFLILVLTFVMMLAICASGAEINLSVELDNGVTIKANEDIIYLPSYVDIHEVKIKYSASYKNVKLNGVPFSNGDTVDLSDYLRRDPDSRATFYELTFVVEGIALPEDTVYIYKSNNLPSIFIDTSNGKQSLLGSNNVDTETDVYIIDKYGSVLLDKTTSEVRVRGNTTPTYAKKPLQIKFPIRVDLLDMGKAKTWVLLANYLDQSYIRNSIMYKLAKELGMGASDFQNVEVFVDGEYQGIYLLCEKVNVNSNRVNIFELEEQNALLNPNYGNESIMTTTTVTSGAFIDETAIVEYKYVNDIVNPADITGGYLIELDNNSKDNRHEFGAYFITKTDFGENLYVIKSPKYCSKEQVEYIARLFGEMEEAMASADGRNSLGKHYSEYVDMDSFAVAYIMAELGRNYDVGGASIYFNKDADVNGVTSKIVKGPLWDCDNVLGNIHRGDAQNQTTIWATKGTPWNMLTRHSDFNALVKEKFEIAYDLIYDMLDKNGFIDQQIKEIGYSAKMDRLRWKQDEKGSWPLYSDGSLHWFNQGGKNTFPQYDIYTDYVNDSTDTAIGYLCLTLEQRTEYLVKYWGCEVIKRVRTLNDPLPEITDTEISPQKPTIPDTPQEPSQPQTPQEPELEPPNETPNPDSSSEGTSGEENEESSNLFAKIAKLVIDFIKKFILSLFSF